MEKQEMALIGRSGRLERYAIGIATQGVASASGGYTDSLQDEYGHDSVEDFDSDILDEVRSMPLAIGGKQYRYAPWGSSDDLPYKLINAIGGNMVLSECQFFNVLTAYAMGVTFVNRDEGRTASDSPEIRGFCMANSIHEVYLQQCTDMKHFFWTACVVVLNRRGDKIVRLEHLDAAYCRQQIREGGKSAYLFYGNFRHPSGAEFDRIPLLDLTDPLGDLCVRMGIQPDPNTGKRRQKDRGRRFAIVCKFPTAGFQYYPTPYYASVFRDNWHDIFRLIGIGKKAMIKNTSAPRLQVEVHADYWQNICDEENINDPQERLERVKKEKQNIVDFVCGPQNAGKALITKYYIDPNGRENRMVRIYTVGSDAKKEGGDWADDMQEASNAICFATGVHPNLIGATPGKTAMNNSGSDKRELFALKQALEKAMHDIMLKPYHVVLHFNGWADRYTVEVPMIELTTLDKNTSAQVVHAAKPAETEEDNV